MRAIGAVVVAGVALIAMAIFVAPSVFPARAPARAAAASVAPPAAVASTIPAGTLAAPTRAPIPLDQLRISVPRLGIDLPMALGDVERDVRLGATPENFALLFPTTNVPGTGGNSFIYAHARNDMFLQLWNVKLGDRVRITATDGTRFDYVITQIVPRVDPADTSWLDQNGPERLTLQTSTGPTGLQPRFIAVAQRLAQVGD